MERLEHFCTDEIQKKKSIQFRTINPCPDFTKKKDFDLKLSFFRKIPTHILLLKTRIISLHLLNGVPSLSTLLESFFLKRQQQQERSDVSVFE